MSFFEDNDNIVRTIALPLQGGIRESPVPEAPSGYCINTINIYPYEEYWVNATNLWINGANGTREWTRRSGSTSSGSTGPTAAARGSYYYYTESSGVYSTYFHLESPCMDLTGAIAGTFRFGWNMYGSTMGNLFMDIATVTSEGIGEFTNLFARSGNYGSPTWVYENSDIEAYVGNFVKFRFRGYTGTSYRSDMAVDDITLTITEGSFGHIGDNGLLLPIKKTIRL